MPYSNSQILAHLRQARQNKGLSQRQLSTQSGVPQSHISKIEQGNVDLRVSSLIALARALDIELMLVPKKSLPAVGSIVRSALITDRANAPMQVRETHKHQGASSKTPSNRQASSSDGYAYSLDDEDGIDDE